MLKKGKLLLAVCMVLSFAVTNAQSRKYSNAFLGIGVDARAFGMGNAVLSSVNDVSSGYWNPAGLVRLGNQYEGSLMHAEYFASIAQYDYLGFAMPVDAVSTVGVTAVRFGVDDILDTSELIDNDGNVDYNRITKFSAADYALLISYARKHSSIEGLNYGGSVKLIYRGIGDFAKAYGFGFDLGIQWSTGNWSFGAVLRDATSTFNAWRFNASRFDEVFQQTGNELPQNALELTLPTFGAGTGYRFEWKNKYSLQSEVQLDAFFDGQRNSLVSSSVVSIEPSLGVEFGYLQHVFLRVGVNNFQRATNFAGAEYLSWQPNVGIGFQYKGLRLDYALTDIGNQSDVLYSNIFSLKYRWSKK